MMLCRVRAKAVHLRRLFAHAWPRPDRGERAAGRRLRGRREGDPDRLPRVRLLRVPVTLREYFRDLTRVTEWRGGARDGVRSRGRESSAGSRSTPSTCIDRFFVQHYHGLADERPLRRGLPLQPDRARRRARLPARLAAVALLLAQLRPPPGRWSRAARTTTSSPSASSPFSSRPGSCPLFHVAMPEPLLGRDVRRRAARARGGRDRRLHAVRGRAHGHEADAAPARRSSSRGALVAIGLNFLLIPPYSFEGAAWATAAAFAVLALAVALVGAPDLPGALGQVPDRPRRKCGSGLCLASLAVDDWVSMGVSIPLGSRSRQPSRCSSSRFASSRPSTCRARGSETRSG